MSLTSLPEAKVVFVGPPGVGKTTLLNVSLGHPFEGNPLPTTAPTFVCHTVTLGSGIQVCLHFWDTAGHERFQAITKPFYRDADIAVLCYAPTDTSTLETWSARVLEMVPNCALVMALTQCDRYTQEEVLQDGVATKTFAAGHGAQRVITSAKTGEGIVSLVQTLAEIAMLVYESRQERVGPPPPMEAMPGDDPKGRCC
jgi:small GTP-binding protein